MTDADRHDAVEHAVKVKALARLALEIGIDEALAAIAKVADRTPREIAAAASRAYRQKVVTKIMCLETEGRGRDAVSIVVVEEVADKHDQVEIESLARKFRRWRDAERRTSVRLLTSG